MGCDLGVTEASIRFPAHYHHWAGQFRERIFGNRVSPKDRADQILACLALSLWVGLSHELVISLIEMSARFCFGFQATLCERYNARLVVRCLSFATRRTSIASSAGNVTLWRTDEVFRTRDFALALTALILIRAPHRCTSINLSNRAVFSHVPLVDLDGATN